MRTVLSLLAVAALSLMGLYDTQVTALKCPDNDASMLPVRTCAFQRISPACVHEFARRKNSHPRLFFVPSPAPLISHHPSIHYSLLY